MSFKFYKQYDSMDCGPTCLQMVAKNYGRSYSLQSLRDKTQIGKEGVNLLAISEAAESIGFRTRSVKLTYETLIGQALLPCILHWDQNHFIVLYKAQKNNLYIADPAKGLLKYTSREFESHWISDRSEGKEEGIALLMEPTPVFYEREDDINENNISTLAFRNILNYILPYKRLILQLFLGLGITSMLQLFLPFLTQSVIDIGVSTQNIHFVYIVLMAQLALFAGRMVIDLLRSWILLHISTRINISILTDFLIKLVKLPVSFF